MKLNWQTKKLGEVCNIVNGSTPLRSNKEFWHNGDVAWFTIDDIREQGRVIKSTKQKITKKALGKISNRLLPPESVLLCCTASVGEYAITKIPLTTNQQFNGLIVKDKKFLDPSFLFYFSSTLKERLLGLSGKTTIDFIPISRLKDIEILIPSLEEQKRIVKIIEGVFYKVVKAQENAEKNLKNSKDLFEAYLQSIFSNPGEDWEVVDFEECIDKVVYTNKVQRKEFLESGKFPIVSQEKDLINGYWDKDEDLFHVKTPCTIFGDHTQILKYIDFDFVFRAFFSFNEEFTVMIVLFASISIDQYINRILIYVCKHIFIFLLI